MSELLDPGFIIWLAILELIAWECEDLEAFIAEVRVDLCHPLVVAGGQPIEASYVCHKGQFFPSRENTHLCQALSIDVNSRDVMKRRVLQVGVGGLIELTLLTANYC